MTSYIPVYELTRGEIVESIHFGAAAVVNSRGDLVAHLGDPNLITNMRSSAKPVQALPFIESNGAGHFRLDDEEVAVMCASHSGTDAHVHVIQRMQAKIGISEGNLLCGTHAPTDEATRDRMLQQGELPTPNRHNCSGKHTGMLGLAALRGYPIENYIDLQHPVQQEILGTFAEMCSLKPADVSIGIDGCSVPTFAIPLYNGALAFARLADPASLTAERATACRHITRAMMTFPVMVAGPGRFDTLLMETMQGKVFTKAGAEGYQGVGLLPGALFAGSPALGIAVKISDGDPTARARPGVVMEILRQLGALAEEHLHALQTFWRRPIHNWRSLRVGEARPALELVWDRNITEIS